MLCIYYLESYNPVTSYVELDPGLAKGCPPLRTNSRCPTLRKSDCGGGGGDVDDDDYELRLAHRLGGGDRPAARRRRRVSSCAARVNRPPVPPAIGRPSPQLSGTGSEETRSAGFTAVYARVTFVRQTELRRSVPTYV